MSACGTSFSFTGARSCVVQRRHDVAVAVEHVRALRLGLEASRRARAAAWWRPTSVRAGGHEQRDGTRERGRAEHDDQHEIDEEAGGLHGSHQDGTTDPAAPGPRHRLRLTQASASTTGSNGGRVVAERAPSQRADLGDRGRERRRPRPRPRAPVPERGTRTRSGRRARRWPPRPRSRTPRPAPGSARAAPRARRRRRPRRSCSRRRRDRRRVVAVDEVDVALEREPLDRHRDVGLAPELRRARGAHGRRSPSAARTSVGDRRLVAEHAFGRGLRGREVGEPRARREVDRLQHARAPRARSRCRTGPCSTAAARDRGPPWRRRDRRPRPRRPGARARSPTRTARRAPVANAASCSASHVVELDDRGRRDAPARSASARRRPAGRRPRPRRSAALQSSSACGPAAVSSSGSGRSARCTDTTRWSRARVHAT